MSLESAKNRFECSKCGERFGTEMGLNTHENRTTEEKHKRIVRAKEFAQEYEGGECVYVLKVSVSGETAYYVGMTRDFEDRMLTHLSPDKELRYRTAEKGMHSREYEVIDLVEVENCNDRDHARYREREKMLEVAIEYDTTDVVGGF